MMNAWILIPNCENKEQIDCVRGVFRLTLAKLLQEWLGETVATTKNDSVWQSCCRLFNRTLITLFYVCYSHASYRPPVSWPLTSPLIAPLTSALFTPSSPHCYPPSWYVLPLSARILFPIFHPPSFPHPINTLSSLFIPLYSPLAFPSDSFK